MNFIYPEQSENIYDSEKHKFKNKANNVDNNLSAPKRLCLRYDCM